MYIVKHIYPFNGVFEYNKTNNENENNLTASNWDASNPITYEIDVAQFIGGEVAHYEVQLKVFSSDTMTEDEIVRLACVNIIRDTDNRYIMGTVACSNDPPSPSFVHSFDVRIYRCTAFREVDNHVICACGHLPPVDIRPSII